MELMELVDNEPTTRPFQCDWDGCGKVCFSLSSMENDLVYMLTGDVWQTNIELQPQV